MVRAELAAITGLNSVCVQSSNFNQARHARQASARLSVALLQHTRWIGNLDLILAGMLPADLSSILRMLCSPETAPGKLPHSTNISDARLRAVCIDGGLARAEGIVTLTIVRLL